MTSSSDPAVFPLPALGEDAPSFGRPAVAPAPEAQGAGWAPPEIAGGSGGAQRRDGSGATDALEEAFARGRAEGLDEGRRQAEAAVRPALEMLAGVVEALNQSRGQFEQDREKNVAALALAVAEKLIGREVRADPAVVRRLVERAIELLPPEGPVEIRVHPEDMAVIEGHLEVLGERRESVQWVADASLDRGSFLMDHPLVVVDGRTDSALRQIYERLHDDDG